VEPAHAFSRRWRDHGGLVKEFHDQPRGQIRDKLSSAPSPGTSTAAHHAAAQVLLEQVAAARTTASPSSGLTAAKRAL
jgi:hypothetical protein